MDIYTVKINSDIDLIDLKQFGNKSFSNKKKYYEHAYTYYTLDKILKDVYYIKNRELEFANRKPFLKDRELFFSISHSGKYVVIAISELNCGIDIEKIKNRDFKSISERMGFNSKTLKDFYNDWTLYEAEYKLNGEWKKSAKSNSIKTIELDGYVITAVSENPSEKFQFYIQIKDKFSKLTV